MMYNKKRGFLRGSWENFSIEEKFLVIGITMLAAVALSSLFVDPFEDVTCTGPILIIGAVLVFYGGLGYLFRVPN